MQRLGLDTRPHTTASRFTNRKPVLEYPGDNVEPSRNSRPVVLLHGTLVEKDGIAAYRDYALRNGHPVNHQTYSSITKGDRIEKSTELASRQINLSRAEVAEKNVRVMTGLDREGLKKAFSLDSELYGSHDPQVETFLSELPGLITKIGDLLSRPEGEVATALSGRLKRLESEYGKRFVELGIDPKKSKAVARELVDTVAPKAIVVGHSAGGYVAYTLAVNPEKAPDDDPFTYDGGNGVGEVLVLSAPIKSGLAKPAPPGVAGLPFYNYEKTFLRPWEQTPAARLLRLNPMVDFAYGTTKELMRGASRFAFMVTAGMTSPLIYALRPGNAQVVEDSSFFRNFVRDKEIPEGVSVIGVTSPHDQLSQEERSRLDTEQPNGHTFSADLGVTKEQLQRERPTWTHVIMTEKPDSFKSQFANHLEDSPEALMRILDPRNDDGVRHEALSMVQSHLESKPELLEENPSLRKALEQVAGERLPFTDSPSYLAYQILN